MHGIIRVRIRANAHASSAIRADLAPKCKAGFRVDLPAQEAVGLFSVIKGNGAGWTYIGALFTATAKVNHGTIPLSSIWD